VVGAVVPFADRSRAQAPVARLPLTSPSWRQEGGTVDASSRWLGQGTVPAEGTPQADMVRFALLDLRQLLTDPGDRDLTSISAGAMQGWRYTWPRDAAFAVAAFAETGHLSEAWAVLAFLQSVQRDDGGFEARYRLHGGMPSGGRPPQADAAGWALWAVSRAARAGRGGRGDLPDHLHDLRPMVDRASEFILRLTDEGSQLPLPSPDYWEVSEADLTLGTAAPMLFGLRAAADIRGSVGDGPGAHQAQVALDRLTPLVHGAFAPGGYQRYAGAGGHDAGVCFLMPPFLPEPRPGVVEAWTAYQREARRPAGGLAPGAGWRNDGISWTPETALVAYTAAASGRRRLAEAWLDWLDTHRTGFGSLPERVLANGSPAGPAPLGWTAASVVLAAACLDRRATMRA